MNDEHEQYMDELAARQFSQMINAIQETLSTLQSVVSTANLAMVNLNNMLHMMDQPEIDMSGDNFPFGGGM